MGCTRQRRTAPLPVCRCEHQPPNLSSSRGGIDRFHGTPVGKIRRSLPPRRYRRQATTINPPEKDAREPLKEEEYIRYYQTCVPIRFARALNAKLTNKPPYWTMEQVAGFPFVLALQDFHAPRSMMNIALVMTEYLFGVRHRVENGERIIERLTEHRYGTAVEPSGFSSQPGTEHVSAVIGNPQGTIPACGNGNLSALSLPTIRANCRLPCPTVSDQPEAAGRADQHF